MTAELPSIDRAQLVATRRDLHQHPELGFEERGGGTCRFFAKVRARSSTTPPPRCMSASPVIRKHPVGCIALSPCPGHGRRIPPPLGRSSRASARSAIPTCRTMSLPHFLTNVLWVASITPFLLTTRWIVTSACREESGLVLGRSQDRRRRGPARPAPVPEEAEPIEEPEADPLMAAVEGGDRCRRFPLFFWFSPRVPPTHAEGQIWLAVSAC